MSSTPLPPPSRTRSPAPVYRRTPVRVACVQFDPKIGMVHQNAARVEELTQSIDLLVLPEMCLSGYMFTTPTSILPYLEPARIGPTSLLARSLAQRLRCHVVAGYPEALPEPDTAAEAGPSRLGKEKPKLDGEDDSAGPVRTSMKALEGEALGVGWNSAVVVGPEGEVVGNYRKTFRFETDKNWAREGDGFVHLDLPDPLGRVAVGICMDMNPKDFVAPWDAFELATYVRENKCDMLVVPMNWLDPPADPSDSSVPAQDPSAPSESNLNYWAARLTPLHDPAPGYGAALETSGPMDGPSSGGGDVVDGGAAGTSIGASGQGAGREVPREIVFVACNRVGEEHGTRFVGTSAVMAISSDPPRIELVECCNVTEERVMVATVV